MDFIRNALSRPLIRIFLIFFASLVFLALLAPHFTTSRDNGKGVCSQENHEYPVAYLLISNGEYNGPVLSVNEESRNLLAYAQKIQAHCPDRKYMGGRDKGATERVDGQWSVCFTDWDKNCNVLSFGIAGDWSFDEAMADICNGVWAFDPTIAGIQTDRKNLIFQKIGIGAKDETLPNIGPVKNLVSIVNSIGINFIDVLKVDVEGSEWPMLNSLDHSDFLSEKVKQLTLEIHLFPNSLKNITVAHTYRKYRDLLKGLEKKGFKLWDYHRNTQGGHFGMGEDYKVSCCHELAFLNTKFFPSLK